MSRKIRNIIWEVDLPRPLSRPSVHLDLGSGYSPRNPFNCEKLIALDIFDFQGNQEGFDYVKADLTKRLPFADESFSSVSAYDVLEHVPRWERSDGQIHFPFIELMNEIWRILKPSGFFYAITPMFPSPAAFGDPTHVNFISESTINYFVGNPPMASSLGYGFAGEFDITFSGWLRGAGPYDRKGSLRHEIEICPSSKKRTILRLKLLRRTLIALCNRNPQHALWVLKKVDI